MAKQPRPGKSEKGLSSTPVIALADFENEKSLTALNFKVTAEFRREFKVYAAQHGMSMVDVLQKSFQVLKERRGR